MQITIHIDDSNEKGKDLLAYLQSLEFVQIESADLPNWQKEQLDIALEKHQLNTNEYSDWNTVKEGLMAKYNLK